MRLEIMRAYLYLYQVLERSDACVHMWGCVHACVHVWA